MSVLLGSYDPTQVNIVFAGVIIDGFAPDTFVKATRNEDTWTFQPSNSGGGGRSRNPNKSGRFEFTLHAASPSNGYLSTIARTDELTATGIGECQVKDRTSLNSKCFAQQAWVIKPADFERQKELGAITWIIETPEISIDHDGIVPA